MDKKNMITMGVVALVFAAGGFFGGLKYGQSPSALKKLSSAQLQAVFAGARGNATGGPGGGFTAGTGTRRNGAGIGGGGPGGGGFVTGQIISKDDKSITVQLPNNGGSKIVFLADSSQVMKSTTGAASDLSTGETVTVTGTANSDGSVTAQNIQIRPGSPPTNQ